MARQHAKVTVKSNKLTTPKVAIKMPKLAMRKVNNGKRKA